MHILAIGNVSKASTNYYFCHCWYRSALDSCFIALDVHFVVMYWRNYKALCHVPSTDQCVNRTCTECLLVPLKWCRNACRQDPNIW